MIRVVLTDIEGTTSSISFVHEVLFPYASEHLDGFVRAHCEEPAVREQLQCVADQSGLAADDLDGVIATLQAWIAADRKETALKALQGMMWEEGYRQGHFQGHIYDDAADYLQRWHDRGLRLFVYSSGSVKAQKLIFGFTQRGDQTPYFSGYFDTRVGAKREAESYRRIQAELGVEPGSILFLSDVEAELDAAEAAGLQTALIVRDGELPSTDRLVAADFAGVDQFLKDR